EEAMDRLFGKGYCRLPFAAVCRLIPVHFWDWSFPQADNVTGARLLFPGWPASRGLTGNEGPGNRNRDVMPLDQHRLLIGFRRCVLGELPASAINDIGRACGRNRIRAFEEVAFELPHESDIDVAGSRELGFERAVGDLQGAEGGDLLAFLVDVFQCAG